MPSKYKRKKQNKYSNECEDVRSHNRSLQSEIISLSGFLEALGFDRYYMISPAETELIRQHLSQLSCIKKDKFGVDIE